MNVNLLDQIVRHIFSNLGVISSDFINHEITKSLMSKDFLLPERIKFENNDGEIIFNKVWGCQISVEPQEIKILLGDCSQDSNVPEYCLLIQLTGAPAYGLYLIDSNQISSESMLACTVKDFHWMQCGTYLQGTFLAGMEQIKDIGMMWSKCQNYQNHFQLMLSFLKFHANIFKNLDSNEG